MNIKTNCTDRKAMAHALAAHLGTTAEYLRTPTYAFRVGNLQVERDGSITGEDEVQVGLVEDVTAAPIWKPPPHGFRRTATFRSRSLRRKRPKRNSPLRKNLPRKNPPGNSRSRNPKLPLNPTPIPTLLMTRPSRTPA